MSYCVSAQSCSGRHPSWRMFFLLMITVETESFRVCQQETPEEVKVYQREMQSHA